jgi:ankyrin repeat protein
VTAAVQRAYRPDLEYHSERADGLLASASDGTEAAVAAFERWGAPVSAEGARLVVAREHGLPDWEMFRAHLAGLGDDPFVRAYRAVEAHDVDGLRSLLDEFPQLPGERGTNGNDLLGMAGATCDERLVELLLERGSDPSAANSHGWTALHQAAYVGLPRLARTLLDAGAPVEVSARGDGGTPLIVALFWGHRETAELLAEGGVAPRNLRAAAGLGRVELVEELAGGTGESPAGAHRAFYRPHSGFPPWRPSGDPQEVLDEALSWAARNDRPDAIEALTAHGAALDADVYRGTALTWAAACGRVAAIERLLALGADPNRRGTFGGPSHGEGVTALHLAAESGSLDAIRPLFDGGADPSIRDANHGGTPADWAAHAGRREAEEVLRAAG